MRIAVVGAGAMGGYYGAMLAHQGYEVHFLMRRDYDAVRHHGLKVLSDKGDFHLETVNCYRRTEDIGPVDLVFVGLKTTSNTFFRELITPLMAAHTRVLTAQNGLGNEESLAALYGKERVAGGLAFICSNRREPGIIQHLDYGFMHLGNYQREPDDLLRQFNEMMNQSGVECHLVDDLRTARWKKLIWNVPFSGLSTLLDITVDKIIADENLRRRAMRLMKEIQAAAGACGVTIADGFLDYMMGLTEKMEPYHTSMHLDRLNKQPLEVESIFGEPLLRGQKHGVDLPELISLYEGLRGLDRKIGEKPL